MTKSMAFAWAVVAVFTIQMTSALGQQKAPEKAKPAPAAKAAAAPAAKPAAAEAKPAEEMPPKPGAETKALSFLAGTMNGNGELQAGAMGPGSPAMKSKVHQACKWTADNLWLQCEISDKAGTGKTAQTWKGVMLIGWDFDAKAYHAVGVDNMGMSYVLNGKMEGTDKFVLESASERMVMGMPVKFRFTFDGSTPKTLKFTDERSMKGGPYQLAETVTFKKGA